MQSHKCVVRDRGYLHNYSYD